MAVKALLKVGLYKGMGPKSKKLVVQTSIPMSGKNRRLVADDSVEFEK